MTHEVTHDKMFYDLGNGEWNIPALRRLLEQVIPEHTNVEDYEVKHEFMTLGERTMLVNACEIRYDNGKKKMLLSIFDVTEQKEIEVELKRVVEQKNNLLKEMRHRIANSLQLIASILLLKAGSVASDEARLHLEDAHDRILSIATVQRHLDPSGLLEDRVNVGAYLTALCEGLAKSMIGGRKPVTITVHSQDGTASTDETVSFGLLTTELVINALKYAFPNDAAGTIHVTYEADGKTWSLCIQDDGVGYIAADKITGLGTSIISSLSKQLGAELVTTSNNTGTTVLLRYPNTTLF